MADLLKFLVAALAASASVNSFAQAKEVPVDMQVCWGGSTHVIAPAPGVSMATYQLTGPVRSNTPGGAFDGAGIECVGTLESISGELRMVGYCITVDRQGDKAWGRDIRNKDEDSFEYIGGTGKYAGITGKVKKERPAPFASARMGTFTGCARSVGTYRTP